MFRTVIGELAVRSLELVQYSECSVHSIVLLWKHPSFSWYRYLVREFQFSERGRTEKDMVISIIIVHEECGKQEQLQYCNKFHL